MTAENDSADTQKTAHHFDNFPHAFTVRLEPSSQRAVPRPALSVSGFDLEKTKQNMSYTDEQLKKTLAKMLPQSVNYGHNSGCLFWATTKSVLDTELLHLCSLVERSFINDIAARNAYMSHLTDDNNQSTTGCFAATSSWQQRVIAAAKVKWVEIL